MVSLAHPRIWSLVKKFVKRASTLLLERYGKCIRSISPTVNNEFETRFSQTDNAMRDYSLHSREEFAKWALRQGKTYAMDSDGRAQPPVLSCYPICEPILEGAVWDFLAFREEFIATQYISLCQVVHQSIVYKGTTRLEARCLLHFGEMFSTLDMLIL